MTNKGKKPTKSDRRLLEFLQNGGIANVLMSPTQLRIGRLSDSIYRLRQDGNIIFSKEVRYTNNFGEKKNYDDFFMVKQEIIPSGPKVEKAMGEKGSISEISRQIQKVASSVQLPLL